MKLFLYLILFGSSQLSCMQNTVQEITQTTSAHVMHFRINGWVGEKQFVLNLSRYLAKRLFGDDCRDPGEMIYSGLYTLITYTTTKGPYFTYKPEGGELDDALAEKLFLKLQRMFESNLQDASSSPLLQ